MKFSASARTRRRNTIARKVAYQSLIAKHFPELKTVKGLSSPYNQEDIIKHIAKIKKPHAKKYYVKGQTRKAKLYVARLPRKHYDKYLDIGASTGHLTREIANLVGATEVVGLDVQSWAEQGDIDRLEFVQTYDGRHIPYEDEHFDLVSLIFTIHHIPNYQEIINEAIRVTKPGGSILIVEHDARSSTDKDIIEFDHRLFMIEKVDSYSEYRKALADYYSKYFSLNGMQNKFAGKFTHVYRYPNDILKRYVAVYHKQNE